jgi:amidase
VTVEGDGELAFDSASSLARRIWSREVSAGELLSLYVRRIERLNAPINAVVTLDLERATARAAEADRATARGESWGPLHGVPVTLKDTQSTEGIRTTAGYPRLSSYVPASDGTIAARLKGAGAILFGKTNTALLAYDQQTTNPIFGRTNNPWDLARTSSGSSGGAVAALAAGLTGLDVGSDAGGSIRVPAHCCGVYGLKPTFGRVSQAGHIPDLPGMPRLDWVLSASGPLARSLDDVALALHVIAGPDGKDSTVPPVVRADAGMVEPRRLKVAWVRTFPGAPVSKEIAASLESLANRLAEAGVQVEEVHPSVSFDEQWEIYQTLSNATWRLRAKLGGIAEVDDGEPAPPMEAVIAAMDGRERVIAGWEQFFGQWDVLLCPPCMTAAYPHCDRGSPILVDGREARYDDECRHVYEFNVSGHPALVCPLALTRDGLPIGVQMVAARWADDRLLAIAGSFAPYLRAFAPPATFA